MTYAEYLKSLGATEEEIKTLDTPLARKAFDNQVSAAAAAKSAADSYQERANAWYEEQKGNLTKAQTDAVAARAEVERLRGTLLEAQRQGLIDVAKDLGLKLEELERKGTPTPPNPSPNGFDPERYFTRDDILAIAEREGEAIAVSQDISAEHMSLFGKPVNFRELRREAVAAKVPVEQFWMTKYNVTKAREDRAKAEEEKKLQAVRDEERKKVEAEWAAKLSQNPNLRVLEPSSAPFAPRSGNDIRVGKQPWEVGTSEQLHDARVRKGTELALKREVTH